MRPQPLPRMAGTSARARKNGVERFRDRVRSPLSGVTVSAGPRGLHPAGFSRVVGSEQRAASAARARSTADMAGRAHAAIRAGQRAGRGRWASVLYG